MATTVGDREASPGDGDLAMRGGEVIRLGATVGTPVLQP